VARSSIGSLDVVRDNSFLCSVRRSSAAMSDAGGGTLSVLMQPSAYSPDGGGRLTPSATEQDLVSKLDDGSVQYDSATMRSMSESSRRDSAAVDLSCSVVDSVSRNRCSKSARRKSLNEAAAVADFSPAGLHGDAVEDSLEEHCQRSAWRRTKSYDMSSYEITVL